MRAGGWSLTGLALLVAWPARGQEPAEPPVPEPEEVTPPPDLVDLDLRLKRTEELVLNRQPTVTWSGYVDFGFFVPQGNGAGYVQDFAHARFPQYADRFGWVFLGDILAPAVNTRGEVADLGDAPGVDRFDSINSRGKPGFILNEANFVLRSALTSSALVTASFNLVPRTGSDFRLGDFFDLDIAQLEWMPTASQRTSIFVGKTDSVIGIEYRERKSQKRFGITPSLIARYTTGPALGLKVRSKFGPEDLVVVAGAVTNGSNTTEQFHFYDEIDSNAGKTVSGRVSLQTPTSIHVEAGFSGSWGAQDRSLSSDDAMWFMGPDLIVRAGLLELKAQWLRGKAPGSDAEQVYGLNLRGGGYAEADLTFGPSLGVYGRGEYRDADVWLGTERYYRTRSWRATVGARWVFTERAVVKAEYLHNGEYGNLPQVPNDVFTSSLVLSY
ncbi:MAG TPA: outer membrane beta-barrel protein [Polyangia bacterium]|nr:outer membrane beta-barrel protein [Polyangia bacterium]